MSSESTEVTQPIQPIQPKANSPVARRALLVTAGLGACAAGAAATPFIAGKVGELTQDAVNQALQDGIQQGREAVLAELSQLEGVTLEGAIAIAELTKLAVNYIARACLQTGRRSWDSRVAGIRRCALDRPGRARQSGAA